MALCSKCWKELKIGAAFCENCGAPARAMVEYTTSRWTYALPVMISAVWSFVAGVILSWYNAEYMPPGLGFVRSLLVDSSYLPEIARELEALDAARAVAYNYEYFWIAAIIAMIAAVVIAIVNPKTVTKGVKICLWTIPLAIVAICFIVNLYPMVHYVNTYGI